MALKAGQNFLSGNCVHISHTSHGGAYGLATDPHHGGRSRAAYRMDVFIPIYLKPMELGQATASWKLLHSEERVQGSKLLSACPAGWLRQGWLSLFFSSTKLPGLKPHSGSEAHWFSSSRVPGSAWLASGSHCEDYCGSFLPYFSRGGCLKASWIIWLWLNQASNKWEQGHTHSLLLFDSCKHRA